MMKQLCDELPGVPYDCGYMAGALSRYLRENVIDMAGLDAVYGAEVYSVCLDMVLICHGGGVEIESLMKFITASGGRIDMQWKDSKTMATAKFKFEADIERNLARITMKARQIMRESSMTAEQVAEKMNMGTVAPVEQIMKTGDLHGMHMRTLTRFVRACGYEVKIGFEKLPKEEKETKAEMKKRLKAEEETKSKKQPAIKNEEGKPKPIRKRAKK